jgi:filamentous hemagglutinin family protein
MDSLSRYAAVTLLSVALVTNPVQAQVIPDNTLPTAVSSLDNRNFAIDGGARSGNNLFHSFSQFSVPTTGSAAFNNPVDVQNIFARVTGGSISNIDGVLSANGAANLFLLNPSGLQFGPNARLNLGGSFLGTTASSIQFADGVTFSAVNPAPLLTMSVPIGLQMGNNPGVITVQGRGNSLNITNILAPIALTPSSTKIQVTAGKTLALVGGNLNLHGATLTAKTGHIELGSLGRNEFVDLVSTDQGYTLGYGKVNNFGDIQLTDKSLLDVSGVNSGSAHIQGKQIQFRDGSMLLAQNYGDRPGGKLQLQATESINITSAVTGVRSETRGKGMGGNINIVTPHLGLYAGGILSTNTSGITTSGSIQVNAKRVEISGVSPLSSSGSFINTSTYATGNAGSVSVYGDSLLVSDGGGLSSVSRGPGSSGEVIIKNLDTTVQGVINSPFGTRIVSSTFNAGDAKLLLLETARLKVVDGGTIGSSSYFTGNAGDVKINATESIELKGGQNQLAPSGISSSALILNPTLRQLFGLTEYQLTANAGRIDITTPSLTLKDSGVVGVANEGSGNGGNINIKTDIIELKNQAFIEAKTKSGNGGNINLQVENLLLLRNNSQITSNAGGEGKGGDMRITAPVIVGIENSDIIANAIRGDGGNIKLTTQALLGIQPRSQLTPDSDITASSTFGVNGTVQVNTISVNPSSGLITLPTEPIDPSQKIATGCTAQNDSSFVATGRGGVPEDPMQVAKIDRTWSDLRSISMTTPEPRITAASMPIEATTLATNAQGEIELIGEGAIASNLQGVNCSRQ